MYYKSLTENDGMSREDFYIRLTPDKEARTLTVSDNGCGMTAEELENNLGTIAKSGSLAFKQENEAKEDIDIIGPVRRRVLFRFYCGGPCQGRFQALWQ